MPIKGISEKRRLHRLGRVRLGKKEANKSGHGDHPVALDHFNFEDAPELGKLFGANCKEIEIILPNEKVDAFFPQDRKAYRTSGLFCRGDGEVATRVHVGLSDGDKNSKRVPKGQPLDPEGSSFIKEQGLQVEVGEMFDMPCAGEDCPFTLQKFCKPIGRFLFIVPKAPRVGVYEISTTSFNSIVELNSSIDTILGIAGRISMIPLKLKLVPKETTVPKSTMKKTIYHLVLEYEGSFGDLAKFRDVKQIPLDQLPSRLELDKEIPDDLAPRAGRALTEEIGAGAAAPVNDSQPDPEPEPEGGALEGEIMAPGQEFEDAPADGVPVTRNPVNGKGQQVKPIMGTIPPAAAKPTAAKGPTPQVAPMPKNPLVKNGPPAAPAAAPRTTPPPAAKPRKSLFA